MHTYWIINITEFVLTYTNLITTQHRYIHTIGVISLMIQSLKSYLKMRPNPEERESSSRTGTMQILWTTSYLVNLAGTFHLANLTPMMWYSKKQATSETVIYGSEFLAARTCIEQIVDLQNSFQYLGVPVYETSYVFGDNESQVKSSLIPYTKLNKRHNILSYHYVRFMIAKGFINLLHV